MALDEQDLVRRFTYHPPSGDQPDRYEKIRGRGLDLARLVDGLVPDGREKALAITAIEQAVMWANAGIARS
jgi:hypothetical protein